MDDNDEARDRGLPRARGKRGRAAVLIERLLASGQVTRERIARELNVRSERLEEFRSGAERMPLNLQARFSLFLIAHVPAFVRAGNQLRRQVAAAIDFETHRTRTSDAPPARIHRFPGSATRGRPPG